eukprot:SAG31_NODE_19407_length_603_cov_0.928571_1_plen_112_part_10
MERKLEKLSGRRDKQAQQVVAAAKNAPNPVAMPSALGGGGYEPIDGTESRLHRQEEKSMLQELLVKVEELTVQMNALQSSGTPQEPLDRSTDAKLISRRPISPPSLEHFRKG